MHLTERLSAAAPGPFPSGALRFVAHWTLGRWRAHAWVAAWMCLQFVLAFYQGIAAGATGEHVARLWLALATGLAWSMGLSLALVNLPGRWAGRLVLAGSLYSAVVLGASAFHLTVYGEQPGVSSIVALLDTNSSESAEYLSSTVTGPRLFVTLLVAGAALALGLLARLDLVGSNPRRLDRRHAAALGIALAGFVPYTALCEQYAGSFALNNPFLFTWSSGREALAVRDAARDFTRDAPRRVGAWLRPEVPREAVHVLILGEAVTPSHLSVYGYVRPTTPRMESLVPGFDRFVGGDVCSSRHNTALSLIDVMTSQFGSEEPPASRPSLISIAREAGYRVVWISNQARDGEFDSLSSAWSRQADERTFVTTRGIQEGVTFDGELLAPFERVLHRSAGPTLVIVHMMGAHQVYSRRYPAAFARWGDADEVPRSVPRRRHPDFPRSEFNRYDNAVRYTDHVVGRLLDVAQRFGAASVTYVSDHGQNLGEFGPALYHSMPDGPRQGFEVPLLFWIEAGYREAAGLRGDVFAANLDRPYQTDRLMLTALDLYGVEWPGRQADESLFSAAFSTRERRCDGMIH